MLQKWQQYISNLMSQICDLMFSLLLWGRHIFVSLFAIRRHVLLDGQVFRQLQRRVIQMVSQVNFNYFYFFFLTTPSFLTNRRHLQKMSKTVWSNSSIEHTKTSVLFYKFIIYQTLTAIKLFTNKKWLAII